MARRGMNLIIGDHAIPLNLEAKARAAEECSISLPDAAKTRLAYGALLNCYCKELMTEKAEVLVKLKDLPGADTCFNEWKSQCSAYNVPIVNALLEVYHKEGMLDKSESFKRRVKRKGARLNAKTWEILMEYYLRNGDMKLLYRSYDRGIKKGRSHDGIWLLPDEVIWSLILYSEDEKDVKGADGFIKLLKGVNKDLGAEVFESDTLVMCRCTGFCGYVDCMDALKIVCWN